MARLGNPDHGHAPAPGTCPRHSGPVLTRRDRGMSPSLPPRWPRTHLGAPPPHPPRPSLSYRLLGAKGLVRHGGKDPCHGLSHQWGRVTPLPCEDMVSRDHLTPDHPSAPHPAPAGGSGLRVVCRDGDEDREVLGRGTHRQNWWEMSHHNAPMAPTSILCCVRHGQQ